MAIADDWDFDYPNTILQHIDGVLSYDTGTGRQAAVGEYIRGNTSGAIGKIIAVTGATATGTLTLTNVVGQFIDNETFEVMSLVAFDGVVDKASSLQGFRIGDAVVDQVTGTITVRAIEYNDISQTGGAGGGGGTLYGDSFTLFTDDSSLDITGGEAGIALADGVGVDNDAALGTTQTNGTLAVPGTASENDSVIIHYDAGTQLIPDQAVVNDGSTGATGLVEQQYGPADGSVGSLRIVDYDSTGGVYTDDNSLVLQQVVNYDNQVGGQVFSVDDVVVGTVSGATGRVLAVVDDGDSTGRIILADESGTWDAATPDLIQVDGVTIAEVENTTFTLTAATLNLPDGIRTEQFAAGVGGSVAQGGIFAEGDSLNIVRKSNSLYTLSQDTFDELLQMDDDEALDATGKGSAYQVVFDWDMPDFGMRFLRKGGWRDTDSQNIWANPQTTGAQNKITDTAFLYDTNQTFRQPQLYIEQNGEKVASTWLEGDIDVLLKVKTWNDTRFIAPATPALGMLLPGGDPAVDGNYTILNREFYTSTYDATQFNGASGGVNTVALGTQPDNATDRNPQGTHTMDYLAGSAFTLLVGETFATDVLLAGTKKVGLVVAQTGDAGASGTVEYVLKSGTQFLTTESLIAEVSGKEFDVDGAPTGVVAAFSDDIAFPVVDQEHTGDTVSGGPFFPGEPLSDVGGWTGRFVTQDGNTIYSETTTGTPDNSVITGGESGATYDPTATASVTFFQFDLNNGEGQFPYTGIASGDLTGASAETMQNVYQYSKYLARAEEDVYIFNGPGIADVGTVGRFFRRLDDAFTEVKPGNPVGVFTGSMAFAQGWTLDTDFIAAADIRSFTVIDNDGVSHSPPNLQSLVISGLVNGDRAAAYRSTGTGLTTILRNEFDVGVIGSGNNQAGDSTVLVGANTRTVSPLPADVPDVGVLRILSPSGSNNTGNFIRMTYSSVDRTTNIFTLTGTIGSFLTAAGEASNDLTLDDNVHVVFIEETASGITATNTIQFVADIPIVYKARIKGIKPFRGTGDFVNTGATLPAQRLTDTIVDLP